MKPPFRLFIGGLTGMEVLIICMPYWNSVTRLDPMVLQTGIFTFSIFLWISAGWFAVSSIYSKMTTKGDINQFVDVI